MAEGEWWGKEAKCKDMEDKDFFFPEDGEGVEAAKAFCRNCPCRPACLEFAIRMRQPGVWGGTSENDRKKIARRRILIGDRLTG